MIAFRRVASVLSIAFFLSVTAALHGQAYTKIVVFGDSLSDTGNFANLSVHATTFLIPGPVANYTAGRFTDGTDTTPATQKPYTGVWIEQLAATLAAKPPVVDSLDGGTNYAYGSATNASGTQVVTYGPGNALSVTVSNVGQQIATYLGTNPTIDGNTLFVVWGGANDLLAAMQTPNPSGAIVAAAQQEVGNVQALIAAGATNIIIPNLPPLGAIPRLNTMGAVAVQASAAAAAYNTAVAAGVAGLPAANAGKTLHLYLLDTFSLFNSILVAPQTVYGLTDVTSSSQKLLLPPVNPDTYTFWDDLHPTTAVHHILAVAGRNLLTQSTGSTATLTLGAGSATYGQSVTLKAVIASGTAGSPVVPTGVVTFYAGTTPLVSATVDSTGTANASFTAGAVSGGPYAITAYYTGDAVYMTSTSVAQALIVTPAVTSTAVSSSNLSANQSVSVTFTATVSSTVGAPVGSVKFMDGTSTLGTVALVAGTSTSTATYQTTSLNAGTHPITAVYVPANTNFSASTSTAINEVVTAPAYTFTASPTNLTVTAGTSGTSTLTVTPVGGYTGTFSLACGTLPAHASCTFSPSTLTVGGGPATSSLTVSTSAATSAALGSLGMHRETEIFAALTFLPGLGGFAMFSRSRRRFRNLLLPAILAVLFAGSVLGMSGCGGSSSSNFTPTGTYQIPVNLTSSGTVVSTANVTLVVQ